MSCAHCDNTGSLSKDLDGDLDCAHCDVATERTLLEAWAKKNQVKYSFESDLWLIYQHGKQAVSPIQLGT